MPGYTYGGTNKPKPAAILNTFEARIAQARTHLKALETEIRIQEERAQHARDQAAQARLRHIRYLNNAPMTPEQVMAEAEKAYEAAMRAHPDNAVEGPARLRKLNYEVEQTRRNRREQKTAA